MAFERQVEIAIVAKEKTKAAVRVAGASLKSLQRTAIAVTAKMKIAFAKAGAAIKAFGGAAKAAMAKFKVAILSTIVAGAGLLLFIRSSITAAKQQELAERKLEAAFLGSGKATKAQINSLKEYASQLQLTTGFGDEQIINAQSMLATFALTSEQVKATTIRMLDMAAATGAITGKQVDLQTVAIALGKGLTGQVGILSRYGVVISDAVKASGDFNDILGELDKNFRGFAELIGSGTFEGSTKGLSDAFGDFKEKLGDIIIKSDAVKGFLKTMQNGFESLQVIIVNNNDKLRDLVEKGLLRFIKFGTVVAKTAVIMGGAFKIFNLIIRPIGATILFIIEKIKDLIGILAKLPVVKRAFKGISDGIENIRGKLPVLGDLKDVISDTSDQLKSIDAASEKFGEKLTTNTEKSKVATKKLSETLGKMTGVTEKAGEAAGKMSKEQKKAIKETEAAYRAGVQRISDTVSDLLFTRLTKKGQDFRDTMINIFRDMGDSIIRSMTNAASTSALGLLGISNAVTGGGGGIMAANRAVRTPAGGMTSGAGIGGAMISPAAAALGIGSGGGGSSGGSSGGSGGGSLSNIAGVGIAAGQGTFSTGGLGSAASLIRLGGSGLGSAIRSIPRVSQGVQSLLGFGGTRILQGGLGLAGGLGSLAGGFAPLGGVGDRGFARTGGAIGGLAGSIGGFALGGGIGAGIGGAAGTILGRLGGGLFGGGSNRRLPLGATSNREFGASLRARAGSITAGETGVNQGFASFGLTGSDVEQRFSSAFNNRRVPSSPQDALNIQDQMSAVVANFKKVVDQLGAILNDTVASSISTGFAESTASSGFIKFKESLKSSVFDNIVSAVVASLGNTTLMKSIMAKTVAPIAEFLSKQGDSFDTSGFQSVIKGISVSPEFSKAQDVFSGVFGGLESLSNSFFPNRSNSVATAIKIPKLAGGGQITRSGLAFVDKGETFSGIGTSRLSTDGGGGVTVDLRGANVNLSSSQDIRTVGNELGNMVKLELNKPRQFSQI